MNLINGILALFLAIILVIAILKIQHYNNNINELDNRVNSVENYVKEILEERRKKNNGNTTE